MAAIHSHRLHFNPFLTLEIHVACFTMKLITRFLTSLYRDQTINKFSIAYLILFVIGTEKS